MIVQLAYAPAPPFAALVLASGLWEDGVRTQSNPAGISDDVVRLELLLNMSGPYADVAGERTGFWLRHRLAALPGLQAPTFAEP